jgi:hypothetical protein
MSRSYVQVMVNFRDIRDLEGFIRQLSKYDSVEGRYYAVLKEALDSAIESGDSAEEERCEEAILTALKYSEEKYGAAENGIVLLERDVWGFGPNGEIFDNADDYATWSEAHRVEEDE